MKTIADISPETRLIAARLARLEPGEVVKYATLSEAIGRDVTGPARGSLMSGRRIAAREHNLAFGTVRGVGIKRLVAGEIPDIGTHKLIGIRRAARRGMKEMLTGAKGATLAGEDMAKMNARLSALGAVELFAKPKSVEKLEKAVAANFSHELPTGRTIELFK